MERLEAALEKARQSRQAIEREQVEIAPVTRAPAPPEPAEYWHKLKEIRISTRLARRNRITTLSQNRQSAPYDILRSRAQRLMRENGWGSLAITSPNSSCGKTTVAVNLAISMARQSDVKVMVLDLDLRRPNMHRIVGHRPHESFHGVIEGRIRAEDQFVRFGENLIFGLNNSPADHPSELLQSAHTQKRIEQIRARYEPDFVIFDMPPMLVSDDNVAFLPKVDAGILVSAADSTTIAQLDTCEKELADLTNVLGVVLNKCRFTAGEAAYDYDYY